MKAIIVRSILIGYLVAASLLIGGEAAASVIYRIRGTVVEADEAALPKVGNHVSGFLELSDRAFALSPPYEFNNVFGDVLDLFIRFGPFVWDLDRPSVSLDQFQGFLSPDKRTLGQYSIHLSENFHGVISDEYCLPRQVCVTTGGGNNVLGLHDGRGFSAARITWTLQGRRVPEPSTISVVGLALAALACIRRRKPRRQT